jgi:hypothetical protein
MPGHIPLHYNLLHTVITIYKFEMNRNLIYNAEIIYFNGITK